MSKYKCPRMLLEAANELSGKTIKEVASAMHSFCPDDLKTHKGFVGQLFEKILEADAHNLDQPDFIELGIELKSIPVDIYAKPLESTFICYANLPPKDLNWSHSRLKRKISKVLWIPYEGDRSIPLPNKRIGSPFLWVPNKDVMSKLEKDWAEITELMLEGKYDKLNAKQGEFIQLRPKAATSKVLINVTNEVGGIIQTVPKGFYFRRTFTQSLFSEHYF